MQCRHSQYDVACAQSFANAAVMSDAVVTLHGSLLVIVVQLLWHSNTAILVAAKPALRACSD